MKSCRNWRQKHTCASFQTKCENFCPVVRLYHATAGQPHTDIAQQQNVKNTNNKAWKIPTLQLQSAKK